MKKRYYITWVLMALLILTEPLQLLQMEVHAESQNGEAVELPHTHSDSGGACYSPSSRHYHSGNSSSGGGCYTNASTTDWTCYYRNTWQFTDYTGNLAWNSSTDCGQTISGKHSYPEVHGVHKRTSYTPGCGYSDGQILAWEQSCSDISCGSLYVTCADTTPGSLTADLTANIDSAGAGASAVSYSWSTGETSQGITVDVNGTYSCEVTYQDAKTGAAGTATASYTVSHLDIIPPEVTLCYTPSEPTNAGTTVHVDATDNVGVTGYSFDGITFSEEQDQYVTENGTYKAYATDAAGNIGEAAITVDNIDQMAPEIVSAEGHYINGEIRVQVTARDVVSDGYARDIRLQYSADGNNWSDSGEFMTADEIQEIFVRDAAGNISTAPITIYQDATPPSETQSPQDWDTTPPSISGIQTPQHWTKDAVCLTVTASDDQSGIPEWAYKWGDGDWNPASLYNVTENGTYTVTVRDAAGNTASYTFHVTQIDRTAPKVEAQLAISDWRDGNNFVRIQASDQESGLAESAYSYDGGVTWTAASEYEISVSGDYLVLVRDVAGNIAESQIHAEKISAEADISDPEPDVSEEYSTQRVTGEVLWMSIPTESILSQPIMQPESGPDLEGYMPKIILSITVPRSSEAELLPTVQENVNIDNMSDSKISETGMLTPLFSWTITGYVICLCIAIFSLLRFFLLKKKKVVLCQKSEDGKYHVVDKIKVTSSEKGYTVIIPGYIGHHIDIQAGWPYLLRFGRLFAKKHKSERLMIQCNGKKISTRIAREVRL